MNPIVLAIGALFFLGGGISKAYANGGIPVISFLVPWSAFLIIPILLLEAAILKKYFPRLEVWPLLKAVSLANVASSLAGLVVIALPLVAAELYGWSLLLSSGQGKSTLQKLPGLVAYIWISLL